MTPLPPVIELRQYTLHPQQRDAFIDLFERELVAPHEALGLRVAGAFRDLDDPDRFVWLRGFADMPSRAAGLTAYYGGPAWQAHRTAANAMLIDSGNVLLLRPAGGHPQTGPAGLVTATVCPLGDASASASVNAFERNVRAAWLAAGALWVAGASTDPTPNNYPRLPVREGEPVIVWLAGFADAAAYQRFAELMAGAPEWTAWRSGLATAPHTLRLAPTDHSAVAAQFIGRPHDFGFLVGGRWQVRNRRLVQRHVGCTEWDTFEGTSTAWSHLGGMVSVDETVFAERDFSGCSVRMLDLAARRWSIYWIDSRTGTLFTPVHGGFCGERGEFFGDDEDGGRPVRVRFVWERLGPDAARWSQAFALPGGAWETNWVMDFQRDMHRIA